jgi:hypothetical protein
MTVEQIVKYPRTQHIEGSRLQPGDEDLESVPFDEIRGRFLVVEEKIDGANSAISFSSSGELLLQSRGHYLSGGYGERHFNLLKTWANAHKWRLQEVLGERFLMYGEWVYAKHTVFYDALPHYFLEFDILDKDTGVFLSTDCRREMLIGLPVASVPVLKEGCFNGIEDLVSLIGPSNYKSNDWRSSLRDSARKEGLDVERIVKETDSADIMEGLYIKVEEDGQVMDRFKFVRASFLMTVIESDSHWQSRPILPNLLRPQVDIFAS